MRCPDCKREIDEGLRSCPYCGARLKRGIPRFVFKIPLVIIGWLFVIVVLVLGVYKIYYWYNDYKLEKLYVRGAYAPTITSVTMDDGSLGHAITFYGKDGDRIFIEEFDNTLEISGGVARMEIPDAYWFGAQASDIEYADVSMDVMLIHESGEKENLPTFKFSVEVPESPVTIISPAKDSIEVNTSIYPLTVQVVPGSSVTVNGNDVTDIVDRSGLLSVNVNVYPVGDNIITLIVNTAGNREARREINIYRPALDIAVELDSTIPTSSSSGVVTVSGKCEPGAVVTVDTDMLENSLTQNFETGAFSFIAELDVIGDNTIRFHVSKDGKADSSVSLVVNYLPSLDEYSRKAWAMDYSKLCMMYEQWHGRIFLCEGKIIDMVYDGDDVYFVMNVAKDGEDQQLIVLHNLTNVGTVSGGKTYKVYADVSGRYLYNGHYYPMLEARYMY